MAYEITSFDLDLIQIYGILKSAHFCLQSNALMCLILIQRQ